MPPANTEQRLTAHIKVIDGKAENMHNQWCVKLMLIKSILSRAMIYSCLCVK